MTTNNIDNKLLKDSLLDLNSVSAMIKESVAGASKELVNESIKEMMSKLITEDDDDEEEVKDTFSDTDEPAEDTEDDEESGFDDGASEESDEESEDEAEGEWGEFDKYKIGEREYDFRSADEADLQGVYSILRNDDNIEVRQDGDDVFKVDNGETEFIIIPNGPSENSENDEFSGYEDSEYALGPEEIEDDEFDDEFDEEPEFAVEFSEDIFADPTNADEESDDDDIDTLDDAENNIKESKIMRNTIFEIALNESDLDYGMRQKENALETATDTPKAGNSDVEEWDDIPHGDNRPNLNPKATPFESAVKAECRRRYGRRINEDAYADFDDTEIWDTLPEDEGPNAPDEEEVTPFTDGIGGPLEENTTMVKQPYKINLAPENAVDRRPIAQRAPRIAKAKVPVKTSPEGGEEIDEMKKSIIRRTNKIMNENKALRSALNKFEKNLNEASVANVNLQNIVRLVTENTTSASEKKSIRAKFAKVKTVAESNMLYNTIKESLNKANTKGLNEAVSKKAQTISAKPTPTVEKVIYKSNDLKESLDLMSRMNKVML